MKTTALNETLPVIPWLDPAAWRLPGLQPLGDAPWLLKTDSFAAQMALRDRLIDERQSLVHDLRPEASKAASECLDLLIETLARDPAYTVGRHLVIRPDGVAVPLDHTQPLLTAGRLVQEDICLMLPGDEEYVLSGAILCFPAGWTLAEKIRRPLTAIHGPVAEYDAGLARRVGRIFDAIRPERPMWRANAILHDTPELFTPRRETDPPRKVSDAPPFVRSERQTLRRLPASGAVVFTILTSVVPVATLPATARAAMANARLKSS